MTFTLSKGRKAKSAMLTIYQDGTYLANNEFWHAEDAPCKANHVRRALDRAGLQFTSLAEVRRGVGKMLRNMTDLTVTDAEFSGISPVATCRRALGRGER